MTYADWTLLVTFLLATALCYRRPALRPVAAALLVYLLLTLGVLPVTALWLRRACFAAWAGVLPTLAWGVWRDEGPEPKPEPSYGPQATRERPSWPPIARAQPDRGPLLTPVRRVLILLRRRAPRTLPAALALLVAGTLALPVFDPLRRPGYLALRVLALGVVAAAWRARRPRTVGQAVSLILGGSCLVDAALGVWTGNVWAPAWWRAVALPATAVTWIAIGATIVGWSVRKDR